MRAQIIPARIPRPVIHPYVLDIRNVDRRYVLLLAESSILVDNKAQEIGVLLYEARRGKLSFLQGFDTTSGTGDLEERLDQLKQTRIFTLSLEPNVCKIGSTNLYACRFEKPYLVKELGVRSRTGLSLIKNGFEIIMQPYQPYHRS